MRFADVLRLSLSALWQQKVRTVLTVAGIAILGLGLTATVSVEEGVHEEFERQLHYGDQLRQVWVLADKARLTEPTAATLRELPHVESAVPMGSKVCDVRLSRDRPRPEQVAAAVGLAAAPQGPGPLWALPPLVHTGRQAVVFVARPNDDHLRDRIIAGRYLSSADADEVLVARDLVQGLALNRGQPPEWLVGQKLHLTFPSCFRSDMEMNRVLRLVDQVLTPSERQAVRAVLVVLRELGSRPVLTARERDTIEAMLRRLTGKDPEERAALAKLRKVIRAAADDMKVSDADRVLLERVLGGYAGEPEGAAKGPPVFFDEELTIVGVLRDFENDDKMLGLDLAAQSDRFDLFLSPATTERLHRCSPEWNTVGYYGIFITVDHERNLKDVVAEVKKLGLRPHSLLALADEVQGAVALVRFVTSFLALLVWLAAALCITNIMFTSVLERKREIGVMKAVGARDRHVQLIFLVEGALLGGLGGALGVLGGWLVSFPGGAHARRAMEQYAFHTHVHHSPFLFPWWLVLGVPLFTTLVAVLAAVLPARRAAKVDPIQALRHE